MVTDMVHPGHRSTKAHPRASVALCGVGQGGACHQGKVGPWAETAAYFLKKQAKRREEVCLVGAREVFLS